MPDNNLLGVLNKLNGVADELRVLASESSDVGQEDETIHVAVGLTPWKLRRTALQLNELVARIETKYLKLLEKQGQEPEQQAGLRLES